MQLSVRIAIRRLILLLCTAVAAALFACVPARAEETAAAERQVLICLQESLPDNQPYVLDGRPYQRDIAEPVLNGERGLLYLRTTQVNHWLFPVSYEAGTPVLYLTLEGIQTPTSISINEIPLSADQPVAVPLGDVAELRIADANARCLIRLMFTALPIIRLDTPGNTYKDTDSPCTLTILDPDFRTHGLSEQSTTYEGVVSRRGGSSARYSEKHPYNFSLMKDGKKWDHSLLGLRTDSDWLLDSAFSDRSRMRNRVLMDVWDEIYRLPWDQTLSGATKGVYVELFIGKKYAGLYVLGEKQDRQQLGLPKAGGKWFSSFFRTTEKGNNNQSPAGFVSLGKKKPGQEDPSLWYNVELRYPGVSQDDCAAHWNDFYDFTRLVVAGSKKDFAEKITDYVDLDNLARYWLFVNATDLTDNMRKNMTFVRLDNADPRFNRYQLIPWDMDASLGRYYSSKRSRVRELVYNSLFERLVRENPQDFRALLLSDWQALRDGPLSADSIMAHFQRYYDLIKGSGADQREMAKHPTFKSYVNDAFHFTLDFEDELRYIRRFLENRLKWLDGRITEICRTGSFKQP